MTWDAKTLVACGSLCVAAIGGGAGMRASAIAEARAHTDARIAEQQWRTDRMLMALERVETQLGAVREDVAALRAFARGAGSRE